jgi:tetratricopeptide (TPR) repeat protein
MPLPASPANKDDPYLAQAAREYAQGHVDADGWQRALKRADGDAAAAADLYVLGRAVALRIVDSRAKQRPQAAVEDDEPPPVRPSAWQRLRYPALGLALAAPVAIAGWLLFMTRSGSEPPAAAQPAAPQAPAPSVKATAPPPAAKGPDATAALARKVAELRAAGNFNVMVLYAGEWTRKEPTNPAAWEELRAGYTQLRQYEDARNAAAKAVELDPDDARRWRVLGTTNLDLDSPEPALAAFEQAAARNAADAASLHAIALLQTRLGRPQDARAALDRAAAAHPGDPVTACLRAGLPQIPVTRDAYTLSRQVNALDSRCHGRS